MKSLATYITEKMIYTKSNTNNIKYDYHPETKEELQDIIIKLIDEQSMEDVIDLNSIDTSEITDMSGLFHKFEGILKIDVSKWDVSNVDNMDSIFKGCINLEEIIGIEKWDVSNVENMEDMFSECKSFNQDISNWDVSNAEHMSHMFAKCYKFNQSLDNWNVSNVINMCSMFYRCYEFNKPLNNWDVSSVENMQDMFRSCEKFNQDISKWNVSKVTNNSCMFFYCGIEEKYKPKFK